MRPSWLVRCRECDEWWCACCENECPVCLVGAGIETGVLSCSHCGARFCGECTQPLTCVQCADPLCQDCWLGGISLCMTCWGGKEDNGEEEGETEAELPEGFHLVPEMEFRDFSGVDRKAWRPIWERHKKPKPLKEKKSGD